MGAVSHRVDVVPIGFLIPEFPQQTHIAWWRVAREMRKLGHRIQVLSTRPTAPGKRVHKSLDEELPDVIFAWPPRLRHVVGEVVRNPGGVWRGARYLASLSRSSVGQKVRLLPVLIAAVNLSSILRKKGIQRVFVHSCATAAHLVAMCNRIMGLRYALRLGGDPDVYGTDHFHKMEMADFVLSASPTYYDELVEKHGVDRSKLFWSWVGTDLESYPVAADWPDNHRAGPLRIVTVARLHPAKGHQFSLEAVGALVSEGVEVTYTIVGTGPHQAAIEEYVSRHGLGRHVRLIGARDTAEIAALLQSTDIFILPSIGKGEAAPAVICEAMACGVPVIATRIGATDHMVRDGIDGFLVPQRDSVAILDHLRELAGDPARLAQMKRAARTSARKFDVRLTAERILALLGLGVDPAGDAHIGGGQDETPHI